MEVEIEVEVQVEMGRKTQLLTQVNTQRAMRSPILPDEQCVVL